MEIIFSRKIPENLVPLYEALTEQDVVNEAVSLINASDVDQQGALLQNIWFLSIVNQTLMGMDEDRDKSLDKIVFSFQLPNRDDARQRFARLLEKTGY